ncbi:DNA polymerase I [Adlercreutzia sp. ZJ154]|uniref:DNA polymerase I n=1 Tax=Adlercreutzia sp. ZJ154 TaxID=2709790 RepID=UPI0013EA9AF8|nr:DNA polymerase I [Adlercreutzia sp. ZJ154]
MPKKVAVIDGNSLMHRAYHAIQTPMSAPDGTPTNAIFGFMQMFCKFIESATPDAVICAFDAGKPEFRMQELPTYKAQRPHMDDELRVQFPIIEELLESMCVPVVKVPGWEGDDILGTIAARDEALGFETLLVTGDKDACQLATNLTHVITTKKGISDVEILGPAEVWEKYGVTPQQFSDYLGLMGDKSDNIPGITGIGPKHASKLLQKYGSIEGIYENIDDLRGKQRERLEEERDMAFLSRQIATIVTDLDFSLDIDSLKFPSFSAQAVTKAFTRYSLLSPLARVLKLTGENITMPQMRIDCEPVLHGSEALALLDDAIKAKDVVGVAVDASGQDSLFETSLHVAVNAASGTAMFEGEAACEALRRIVCNASFSALDVKEMIRNIYPADTSINAHVNASDLACMDAFDLGLAAYILNSTVSTYTYEQLSQHYLGGELPKPEDDDMQLAYKACVSRLLEAPLRKELAKDGSDEVYKKIDLPLVPVLLQMERVGMAIDCARLSELGEHARTELTALSDKIYDIAGETFNIDSPKQLAHILFEVMGIPPMKKNRRGYSTNASVLKELAKTHDIAALVIRYRELAKIKSTYIDSLPKMRATDMRVHTQFHETVTATGRLSSSNPNLQNIPVRTDFGRKIRECFVPLSDKDVFLSADYSQIELRLLAHLSGDKHLIDAFNSGEDFHANTAARVFDLPIDQVTPQLRSRAKAVNFGIVYGQQAFGLSQNLDIPIDEAREMIDRYFDAYPGVRSFLDSTIKQAEKNGYAETMFGRKRRIPELSLSNKRMRGVGERTAMNHPMQGSAADVIKLAMIEVAHRLTNAKLDAKMMVQVHDELDFSVPKDNVEELAALVSDVMENVVQLKVPLVADVSWGLNWSDAH